MWDEDEFEKLRGKNVTDLGMVHVGGRIDLGIYNLTV